MITDLNYLLSRHQIALFASRNAANPGARHAHDAFARAYRARIEELQTGFGSLAPMVPVG